MHAEQLKRKKRRRKHPHKIINQNARHFIIKSNYMNFQENHFSMLRSQLIDSSLGWFSIWLWSWIINWIEHTCFPFLTYNSLVRCFIHISFILINVASGCVCVCVCVYRKRDFWFSVLNGVILHKIDNKTHYYSVMGWVCLELYINYLNSVHTPMSCAISGRLFNLSNKPFKSFQKIINLYHL